MTHNYCLGTKYLVWFTVLCTTTMQINLVNAMMNGLTVPSPWFTGNLFQKLLFLNQLTHNMTTAQNWGEHVVYRNCFWHSEHFLYKTCSPHFLHKEEILTKIYLYHWTKWIIYVGIETILKAYSQYGVAHKGLKSPKRFTILPEITT